MTIRLLTAPEDLKRYDAWVRARSHGNLWQSLERKKYLEAIGKETRIYVTEDAGGITASAMVMIDKTSFGLSTWDIARGPLGPMKNEELKMKNELLETIIHDAKKNKAISVFLSPSQPILHSSFFTLHSRRHIHCTATRIVDLTMSEEEILKQMKPKGRYNIGVAEKHGVTVAQSDDIDVFYALVKETTARDGFTGLSRDRYKAFLTSLPGSFLLLASVTEDGRKKPVAGLLGVIWNGTGIYYYGASSYEDRALMAPYALQWDAMKLCKGAGCSRYDLLGVAPADAPAHHPWQGITSFKEKFGGTYMEYPPEQEIVLRPITKKALSFKRKIMG